MQITVLHKLIDSVDDIRLYSAMSDLPTMEFLLWPVRQQATDHVLREWSMTMRYIAGLLSLVEHTIMTTDVTGGSVIITILITHSVLDCFVFQSIR